MDGIMVVILRHTDFTYIGHDAVHWVAARVKQIVVDNGVFEYLINPRFLEESTTHSRTQIHDTSI